jgi:hypothetical protein
MAHTVKLRPSLPRGPTQDEDKKKDEREPQFVQFTYSWCIVCARDGDSEGRLHRCSRCQLVGYCGEKCQRKDWPQHKKVCKGLGVLGRYIGEPTPTVIPFGPLRNAEWYRRASAHAKAAESAFPPDQRFILHSVAPCLPHCSVCLRGGDLLQQCHDCKLAWWCPAHVTGEESVQHRDNRCHAMADGRRLQGFIARGLQAALLPGAALPAPTSWQEYFRAKRFREQLEAGKPSDMVFVRGDPIRDISEPITANALSLPLSTLHALRKYCPDLAQRSQLCIHVLNVTPESLHTVGNGWEEALHCLPNLKNLQIFHFGTGLVPELFAVNASVPVRDLLTPMRRQACPQCSGEGRVWQETACGDLWHKIGNRVPKPDFFVAHSCGYENRTNAAKWAVTLGSLPPRPLLVLSARVDERDLDADFLGVHGFPVVETGANPFVSSVARFDPRTIDGVFYDNAYYCMSKRG